jgi:hypothetical protein
VRKKRLLVLGGLAFVLSVSLVAAGRTPASANPGGLQDFDLDVVECLLPGYPPDTVSPDPLAGPYQVCGPGEDLSAGGAAAQSTAIALPAGDRQGYPYVYSGPGWQLQNDAQITDNTVVGDVTSAVDIMQDGLVDIMADSSNCGGPPNNCSSPLTLATAVPAIYREATTAWGPGTGCTGEDESYLTAQIPGAAAMTPYVRYRACLDTLFLQGKYRFSLSPTVPLNLVTLHPLWSPAGTLANVALSPEAPNSPTTSSAGVDSPQSSISHTYAPFATNPVAPGLYVRWATEISTADEENRALNFVLTTSCKAIGGPFPDADADCWDDAIDTNPAYPDQDGDGLPDGIEVAWGSNPNLADTDGDGRTDLEEMVGPAQFLTNPLVADTDADGVDDGGLTLDASGDGIPDFPDENGDGVMDAGRTVVSADMFGSHTRMGWKIVGTDIEADGAGADNCGSIPNPPQLNTDYDTSLVFNPNATRLGNGNLYGDACDTDDDQDEILDDAETTFQYDQGAHQCSNDALLPGSGTPLNPLNPDTDGDGVLDGVECLMGSNPIDAGDSIGGPGAANDPDNDGVANAIETYQRSQGFSGTGNEDVDLDQGGAGSACDVAGNCGQTDPDSDNDGLSDGCEAFVTGTSLVSTDTDDDGVPDNAEPGAAAAAAAHCNSATDLDGDTVLNGADNCPMTANAAQTSTAPKIGNGKGIAGDDGTVPWSLPAGTRGDACNGDLDNDGIPNASDTNPGGATQDITYDDNNDGTWKGAGDGGTSWDDNSNAKLDGREGVCPLAGTADTDGDGLLDKVEYCKWGSSPITLDSNGNGKGDCKEVADVDGNGVVSFTGDVIAYAKAIQLPPASFGQDGDFDIDGNNALSFTGDVIQEAKYGQIAGLCR